MYGFIHFAPKSPMIVQFVSLNDQTEDKQGMPQARHSVLIIEDRNEIAARLREAVKNSDALELAGSADTVEYGLKLLFATRPRMVLVDLGLPDGSGVEIIHAVTHCDWPCDALVISIFGDEARVIEAIQAGAKGYLLKSADLRRISKDILAVIDGGSPISPAIARHLLSLLKHQVGPAVPADLQLTNREAEVLQSVALGYKRREIAKQLNISTGTVGNHINSIYRKLNVGSNIEAIRQASRLGLL